MNHFFAFKNNHCFLIIPTGAFLCLDMPINKPNVVEKVLEMYLLHDVGKILLVKKTVQSLTWCPQFSKQDVVEKLQALLRVS